MREVIFRCALLSKAALEAACHVPCGGSPYGDANLLFIANDWHTALLPVYLQARGSGLAALLPCTAVCLPVALVPRRLRSSETGPAYQQRLLCATAGALMALAVPLYWVAPLPSPPAGTLPRPRQAVVRPLPAGAAQHGAPGAGALGGSAPAGGARQVHGAVQVRRGWGWGWATCLLVWKLQSPRMGLGVTRGGAPQGPIAQPAAPAACRLPPAACACPLVQAGRPHGGRGAHEHPEGGDHQRTPHRGRLQQVRGLAHEGRSADFSLAVVGCPTISLASPCLPASQPATHPTTGPCRRYAEECQTPQGGWGLDGVLRQEAWKLKGVINGIDGLEW